MVFVKEILRKSQLFCELNDDLLEEVLSSCSGKRVPKGEIIFNEGESAPFIFIVGSGKVKIFKLSPEGKEQILLIANPGDTFAEAALFIDHKYPASAQALENCELIAINCQKFVGILERNTQIALNLIIRLSTLLHRLSKLVEDLSLSDITTRLAHYFLEMIKESNHGREKRILTLTEKKSILASQLGTIPETLSRSLAKMAKDNIIAVDGATIKILDMDKLRKIAGES